MHFQFLLELVCSESWVWLIDGRGLAEKVKNAGLPVENLIKDCGVKRECPNCQYQIDNTDVSEDWPGLPAGVKFDPSDVELLEHLAAKCGVGVSEPHKFIDEFIPTLEGNEGICYTHPENLPGAKKDGSSVYFFYRTINAYATGKRKRRRIIHSQESSAKCRVRWHKTGKTRPVIENVVLKGFKKILVLYGTSEKGSKPGKCDWIMHQYHIGGEEDEKEGEYVVSKIFYQQQKKTGNIEKTYLVIEESDLGTVQVVPRTPNIRAPHPPRPQKTPAENLEEPSQLDDETDYATCLAGETQAFDLDGVDSHLCINVMDSNDPRPKDDALLAQDCSNITDVRQQHVNAAYGFTDLYNLELDTPPDFHLSDLEFASQDSLFDWLSLL
ncbi:SUPPRESSOR OF GAMMA RESPONSE 1-like isoform X2 [Primulina eburnea]|uniref:SUPPRESSOR OF GAMMA RESPONSE 1-like isoform X2 n=1 Tax=Primulina eburnea TaxID=1245227 RepID=UPI003C6C7F3B